MSQNQESGAEAVEYGLSTAREIATQLGAKKIGNPRSNEYDLVGKNIVIKCARKNTKSVGVPYHMLERLSAIFGCFENENGEYEIIELCPNIFSENMRPTRSKGASAGRVGMVRKALFYEKGKSIKKSNFKTKVHSPTTACRLQIQFASAPLSASRMTS